jgi:hypothetical protein
LVPLLVARGIGCPDVRRDNQGFSPLELILTIASSPDSGFQEARLLLLHVFDGTREFNTGLRRAVAAKLEFPDELLAAAKNFDVHALCTLPEQWIFCLSG